MTTFPLIQRRKFYSEVGVEHADEMYANYIKEQEAIPKCLTCGKRIINAPKKKKHCSKKCYDHGYYIRNMTAIKKTKRDDYYYIQALKRSPIEHSKQFDVMAWNPDKTDHILNKSREGLQCANV